MDSSPANSPIDGGNKKRKRVSRACDACFSKKDRCDGVRPICKVCRSLGRPCTYNRPERKRGPSQGVRQRLEGQIESLESLLGYMVDSYPQMCCDVVKNLRLEDAEASLLNSPSPSTSTLVNTNIYPRLTRPDAREMWRVSSFAKALAPSLGLILAGEDDDDELDGRDGLRHRIEEAKIARSRLYNGIMDTSPSLPSTHHHNRPAQAHYYPPAAPSASSHASQFPHYIQQHYPPKERSYPPMTSSHHPIYAQEHNQHQQQQQMHQAAAYQSHPPYSHPPDPPASTSSVVPHVDPYGSYPGTSISGETDALAYALGLTYTSSPQNDQLMGRHLGPSSHPSSWLGPSVPGGENQGDLLRSIDQHMQSTSQENDDNEEEAPTGFNFFSDHDLSLQSNNQQLSVLHQLGLQGSIDMPTPVDHSDRGNAGHGSVSTPATDVTSSAHHGSSHWLQPIRGIN